MNFKVTVSVFSIRFLTSSRALRLERMMTLLLLLTYGHLHGQSIGAVSARQEGEMIIISVPELTDLEARDLTYFYSMDSGRNWNEISKDCLDFDGEGARWSVLDCMNTEVFEGSAIRFKVDFSSCRPVRFDGYEYKVVQIGSQCWFAENLRTSVYANGEAIPGSLRKKKWSETNSGAQAVYNVARANLDSYGRLYNWHAVDDARGLCPSGWHVPSDEEWNEMSDYLGGRFVAGSQMKSSPSNTPSWDGSNTSGFSGLPGGYRDGNGNFYNAGSFGYWWGSSPANSLAWYRKLYASMASVSRNSGDQRSGLSVRCVRD